MEQQSTQKYTSEKLSSILEKLSLDQIRFVVARQEYGTDKNAAESIGIKPQTVYRWPTEVDDAVRLMAVDGLVTAQHIRRKALAKAMLIKVKGLDSGTETIRQRVASEIIEWEMGKALQKQEITGADGEPLIPKRAESALEKVYGNGD